MDKQKSISGEIVPVNDITEPEKKRMFELMDEYYEGSNWQHFLKDLSEKAHVIMLRDSQTRDIQGFSTQMTLEAQVDGVLTKALFSGDTIINKDYWGESALAGLWGKYALSLIDSNPHTPLFWFLISKGYKTYKFLPVFFNEFYPRADKPTPVYEKRVIDAFARLKFPDLYDAEKGIILADDKKDKLRGGVADITEARLRDEHIRYFVERNPNWKSGDELACIAPLSRANFNRMAYRAIESVSK